MNELLQQQVELILFFGAIALLVNWIAWTRHFFSLPPSVVQKTLPISFTFVGGVFAIYLGTSLLLAPIFAKIMNVATSLQHPPVSLSTMGWLQLLTISLNLTLLFFFCAAQDKNLIYTIWKDPSRENKKSILYDFGVGAMCWIISFPTVIAIGQLCDMLVEFIFGFQAYEQVAVRYLKMALASPGMFALALLTVLAIAPVIEEFLFRGVLQNWLKKHLGTKAAIFLTSACFALFHLAPSQGVGNISLALSLFAFAFFLGFIYERQGSLFASIGLHSTFNAVSTFRILFMQE